jgi:ABC-type transport system involved in multi-copper enzyme maturation permease subunit
MKGKFPMIKSLRTLLVISNYTFVEILKSRIIVNIFLIGIFLTLVTYVASEFTFGVPQRVALDFGFGTLSLTSIGVSLFLGVGLLSKEIENRTVYMVLSRPVSRTSFLTGRILGMLWIQLLILIILSGFSLFIYFFYDGQFDALIFWNYFFIFLESLLVLLIVVFFSLITNPIIAVCNTLILLFCGHVLNDAKLINFTKNHFIFQQALKFYGFLFPNFYKLNIKDFVLYDQRLPISYIWSNVAYGIFYSLFLITLSCLIFKRKNLD